jgi:putative SOS response-associated peptidase YedK
MCASYMIRSRNPEQFGIPVEYRIDIEEYAAQIFVPYQFAPVIRREPQGAVLTAMRFSLLPSWSKEAKVKFATHNARLETMAEKPTWKSVLVRRHALVPLTDFIEPIYTGELAGHMVAFSVPEGQVIFAAAVWDEWVQRETGEVIPSFSIITSEPLPFVREVGHDRSPVFLNPDAAQVWLQNEGASASTLQEFLLHHRHTPPLVARAQRALKAGWEKRRPQ